MDENRGEASGRAGATPKRELGRLGNERERHEDRRRALIRQAALEASGEVGYRRLSVRTVLERSGVSRNQFYRDFESKADCYSAAYEAGIEQLSVQLLATGCDADDWLTGFRGALVELGGFVAAEPGLAKGLLAEVHVAGGAAMEKRKEVFERLSRAIDCARRETSASRHSPPPITAPFILGAIETAVLRTLINPPDLGGFAATIPDLVYIAAAVYFDEPTARRAAREAR